MSDAGKVQPADGAKGLMDELNSIKMCNEDIRNKLKQMEEKSNERWIRSYGIAGSSLFGGAGLGAIIAGAGGNRTALSWVSIIFFIGVAFWAWYCLRDLKKSKQQ